MEEEYQRQTREERKAASEEVYLGIRASVGIRNGVQCTNHAQDQTHIIFFESDSVITGRNAISDRLHKFQSAA